MVLLGRKNKLTTTVDFISQSNKAINIQLRFWDDNWYDDWTVKVYREDVLNSWQKYIGKELLRSRPWNYMIWTVRFHVAVRFTNKLRHVLTEGIIHGVIGIYMVRVPILLVRYLKILNSKAGWAWRENWGEEIHYSLWLFFTWQLEGAQQSAIRVCDNNGRIRSSFGNISWR